MWSILLPLTVGLVVISSAQRCSRQFPAHVRPKTAGNRDFHIRISGNPSHYTPGRVYTVRLLGWRSQFLADKFTAFSVTVASAETSTSNPQEAGMFQLMQHGVARLDSQCPGTITQSSTAPKSEAQALWKAPPPGAGCVTFRAMVAASRYAWFMDEGGLTKTICEAENPSDVNPNPDPQTENPAATNPGSYNRSCCPCEQSTYTLQFEGLWSRARHPHQFPAREYLNHFSDLLAVTHVPQLVVWAPGQLASTAVQRVAEFGDASLLQRQFSGQGDAVKSVSRAPGLWHPNVLGNTSTTFTVDHLRHQLSAITMLGPSPDWILGVSGMNLCLPSCRWLQETSVDLGLYDAGTDSGISYQSANAPTSPHQPIRLIDNTWPTRSPFYQPGGPTVPPLARITLTRGQVTPLTCDLPADSEHLTSSVSDDHTDQVSCMMTAWSDWTACSAVCGSGFRMRSRRYKLPDKAAMMSCQSQLVQKVYCDSPCGEDNGTRQSDGAIYSSPTSDICAVSDWTPWSQCSVTCGKGVRVRRRSYLNRMGRKKCFLQNEQKKPCMGSLSECSDEFQLHSECPVSDWSDWSPCSASCGSGLQTRVRFSLQPSGNSSQNQPQLAGDSCQRVPLMQKRPCMAARTTCQLTGAEAKEACMEREEKGDCRGYFPRWRYDSEHQVCVQFIYTGCRGNSNNFRDQQTCSTTCSVLSQESVSDRPRSVVVDCQLSEWSVWGKCSVPCGLGRHSRFRTVQVRSSNGGKPCPGGLAQFRRCSLPAC